MDARPVERLERTLDTALIDEVLDVGELDPGMAEQRVIGALGAAVERPIQNQEKPLLPRPQLLADLPPTLLGGQGLSQERAQADGVAREPGELIQHAGRSPPASP